MIIVEIINKFSLEKGAYEMNFIIGLLLLILGLFVGSLGLIQIAIMLFFSIPYTFKIYKLGLLTKKWPIIIGDLISISIWTCITLGISKLVFLFAPESSRIGYLVGFGLCIFGLGQAGANKNNLSDYFSNHYKLVNIDALDSPNINEEFAHFVLDIVNKKYDEHLRSIIKK